MSAKFIQKLFDFLSRYDLLSGHCMGGLPHQILLFKYHLSLSGLDHMTSLPPTTAATLRRRVQGKLAELLWPLVWVAILVTAGGVGLRAVSVMTQNPPLPDCTQISALKTDSEQLLCARASVRSGSAQALIEAIELVAPWPESHPLYAEANQLMDNWSKALLDELEQMTQRGDIDQARDLAQRIPTRVEVYPEVKSALATWDKEWQTGKEFEAATMKAIAAQDWATARREVQNLKILNANYWVVTRHDQLKEKIDREQTAEQQLVKARALAKTGDLKQLGEAFAIAKAIDLETAAWKASKPDMERWAQQVMQYSFQKWEEEDINAAITVVQLVPPDLALTAEAQDLLSYGHAQRLANDPYDHWTPSYGQVFNLLEAIKAVQRISPTSPFYNEAQESLAKWQQKLDDIVQLQYASTLANVGHRGTYYMAIAKAEQITQERPQRVQAQTLVSHWRNEVQRIEDRPILSRALQFAKVGGKENLQRAIAEAQKVEIGRALRVQGQTYIAEWSDRIETLEDQPILTKAQSIAATGNLKGAIAEAQKVKKGRALFADAQSAIKDWVAEIQIEEDGPILARAENLAARGSLTAAIDMASLIGPGRALSGEAYASIAIWQRERAYIWSLDAPAPAPADFGNAAPAGFNEDSSPDTYGAQESDVQGYGADSYGAEESYGADSYGAAESYGTEESYGDTAQ
jgi:hypothetical protein